jgi:hypothetical protein
MCVGPSSSQKKIGQISADVPIALGLTPPQVAKQEAGECLLGYKTPVCTSQETLYLSATEPSRLMLYEI